MSGAKLELYHSFDDGPDGGCYDLVEDFENIASALQRARVELMLGRSITIVIKPPDPRRRVRSCEISPRLGR